MVPMIRAASLRGFAPLVEELGGDPDRLLERFALSGESIDYDDDLIPIEAHDLMLDTAAAELDCPDLGLRMAGAPRKRQWPVVPTYVHGGIEHREIEAGLR